MEYVAPDRLDGKVARVFHKILPCKSIFPLLLPPPLPLPLPPPPPLTLTLLLPPLLPLLALLLLICLIAYCCWDRYINCYELRLGS